MPKPLRRLDTLSFEALARRLISCAFRSCSLNIEAVFPFTVPLLVILLFGASVVSVQMVV